MSPTATTHHFFHTKTKICQKITFILTLVKLTPKYRLFLFFLALSRTPALLCQFTQTAPWPLTPSASFCINSHSIRLDSTLLSLNKVLGTRDLDNKSSVNYLRMAISILLGCTPIWTFINQYKSSIIDNNTCFTSRAKKKEWKGQPKKSKKSMSPHFEGGKPFNDPLVFNSFKQLLRNGHHARH